MHYVYYLVSKKLDFHYVGVTGDLQKRLNEHNSGENKSTKFYVPLKLVYYEAYGNERDAIDREHKLKHHGSVIGHLKRRLKHSLTLTD
jgi:putative endonuclease